MDDEQIKISKHSSGVSIIIRLDQLWKNCHSYKRNNQYKKWSEELDSVWLELSRDLFKKKGLSEEDEDFQKVKIEFDKFDVEIAKIGQIMDERPAGFEDIPKEALERRNKHYKELMKKHEFLTRLENHLGKGTTFDDEDEDWD